MSLSVWVNDGSGRLEAVKPLAHGLTGAARDLSVSDLDGDGRLDIVAVNGSGGGATTNDGNLVFLNRFDSAKHFLILEVSPRSKLGLGARVSVCAAGGGECPRPGAKVIDAEEVRTDFCYRSRRSNRLHFGLGPLTEVDVTVRAPGGATKTFERSRQIGCTSW